MGYSLYSENGIHRWRFHQSTWRPMLDLALAFGWEPAGAVYIPEEEDRSPSRIDGPSDFIAYVSNDGFLVTKEDADALADALSLALLRIPDAPVGTGYLAYRHVSDTLEDYLMRSLSGSIYPPNFSQSATRRAAVCEYWSGEEGKEEVESFIAFCRQGGFRIW